MLRIDAHAHIFTLRSVLSSETVRVMTQRLRDKQVPSVLVDAIEEFLIDQLKKPELFDECELLKALFTKLLKKAGIRAAIPTSFTLGSVNFSVDTRLDDWSAERLSDLITKTVDNYAGGGLTETILNVLAALRQSMRHTITDVADDILAAMKSGNSGDDCVIVGLMLDVFGANESTTDRATYLSQINGTAEAALQRPGRILPFFGVHPDRPGHLQELKAAVTSKGFVGVKLYPSLDYKVDSPAMRNVYAYCMEADLPVVLHCSHGGFYRTQQAINQCDPEQWEAVLADFPQLRVCFAHFGGWEGIAQLKHLNLTNPPAQDNWARKIYLYMQRYPNVFTDLAYHMQMFEKPEDGLVYFKNLRELLADPIVGHRVMYGTDAWLLRLDMAFDQYVASWKSGAAGGYDTISSIAPQSFLGFAGRPGNWRENIRRFVDFMRDNRTRFGSEPASWLAEALSAPYAVDRDHPSWDFRRMAVRDTYQFLGQFLSTAQKKRGYRANRLLPLRELSYFDKKNPNFQGACRHMARTFIDFADTDVGYSTGYDFNSVVDQFERMFREGTLTLCDVAMTLDTVLDYSEKIA